MAAVDVGRARGDAAAHRARRGPAAEQPAGQHHASKPASPQHSVACVRPGKGKREKVAALLLRVRHVSCVVEDWLARERDWGQECLNRAESRLCHFEWPGDWRKGAAAPDRANHPTNREQQPDKPRAPQQQIIARPRPKLDIVNIAIAISSRSTRSQTCTVSGRKRLVPTVFPKNSTTSVFQFGFLSSKKKKKRRLESFSEIKNK